MFEKETKAVSLKYTDKNTAESSPIKYPAKNC